jgi:hypothetical protein
VRAFKLRLAVPTISDSAYVAPGAVLVGDVSLAENTSVWFNAVLRGDNARITIGKCSNVQEGKMLNTDRGRRSQSVMISALSGSLLRRTLIPLCRTDDWPAALVASGYRLRRSGHRSS